MICSECVCVVHLVWIVFPYSLFAVLYSVSVLHVCECHPGLVSALSPPILFPPLQRPRPGHTLALLPPLVGYCKERESSCTYCVFNPLMN